MKTAAMKERQGIPMPDTFPRMTQQLIDEFLNSLKASGRKAQTVRTYRRSMEELYDFLPEGKEVTKESLEKWREDLKANGYSESTINLRLTAANGLLRFCGREELAANHERILSGKPLPELSRTEYLYFLSAVREMGTEKEYFLVKVLATIDISIGELHCLTVEACKEGVVHLPDGQSAAIPNCLKEELLQYAKRHNIAKGPVFITRTGTPLDRSNIANEIHRLAVKVGMDPEKCSPSALHRVYLTTKKELMERLQAIYTQSYESLLDTEQMMVAWKE
ncbi:MAG: site-specific integrase [Lachnospiraceae bacterium]|nr:site-specific integrase [Lachnospiraceae bacterium]